MCQEKEEPIGPELKVSVRWHMSSPLVRRSRSQPREGECGWKVRGQDGNSAFNEGLELTMNQLKITVLSASCSPKYTTLKYVNTYTVLPANLLGSLSKASFPPYHTSSFLLILFSMNRTSHGDLSLIEKATGNCDRDDLNPGLWSFFSNKRSYWTAQNLEFLNSLNLD